MRCALVVAATIAACGGNNTSVDAGACTNPAPPDAGSGVCPSFAKKVLDTTYRAEGVGVLDVDKDGHMDIVTDQFWFAGPCFTPHQIRPPVPALDPRGGTYADCFGVYPHDLNGDGWTDIIVNPHLNDTMYWYENPHGKDMHWPQHVLAPAGVPGIENPIYEELFTGEGPVLVMTDTSQKILGWWEVPADPTKPWMLHPISASGFACGDSADHGIGVGDVNRDGKSDVLTSCGWFEQRSKTDWITHTFSFGPDPAVACSRMWTFDYDGDGLNDVICARPHDYGTHWWQQQPPVEAGAEPAFVDHRFDDTLSEMHALRLHDFDKDGVPEIITGKRWLAHADASDPGANDPSLLVCYGARKDPAQGAIFTRQTLDDDSGVGGAFTIADVDGDGKDDIVTANKKGLFFFRNVGKP